jgi:hypothetical protein
MLNISLAGLVGAVVGTFVAAIAYGPLALLIERGVHSVIPRLRRGSVGEISILRRVVLAADILVFGGGGYWLGAMIGD